MQSERPTVTDHNWAKGSVVDLVKTCLLNVKLYRLGIWPTLLMDMTQAEYRDYASMLERMLNRRNV